MSENSTTIIPGIETLTVAGAKYVRKVTHPPTLSDSNNEYYGTPDRSAPNVVLLECKGETNVPIVFKDTASTVLNPGRVLFMSGSGMRASTYVFFWVNNSWVQPQITITPSLTQSAPPATLNSGYNFQNWANDIGDFRTTYKSETYYLNATGFNNQGTVTCAKFKPNIIVSSSQIFSSTASDASLLSFHEATIQALGPESKYAKIFNSHLNRLASSNVSKQEEEGYEVLNVRKSNFNNPSYRTQAARLAASQYNFNFQYIKVGSGTGSVSKLGNTNMFAMSGVLPETMSDVLTSSPKGNTRPATEGAFVVHQQVDDVLLWQPNTQPSGQVSEDAKVPGLTICYLAYYSTIVGDYFYCPDRKSVV